jgi:cytochrome oxidase assembly protein ShyY1
VCPAISTVCYVTDKPLKGSDGRTWRLSAALVGLTAMFFAGWAVNALDIDNSGSLYFVAWLALAVGLIGIATVVLVPRAQSRQRRGLVRRTHRS